MLVGEWWMVDGGHRMVDGGLRMVDGERYTNQRCRKQVYYHLNGFVWSQITGDRLTAETNNLLALLPGTEKKKGNFYFFEINSVPQLSQCYQVR